MRHTRFGRVVRATVDDPEVAALMGIDARRVYAAGMALALGIAGLAGWLYGIKSSFNPLTGGNELLFAFEAVIIGGLGSIWGSFAGGLVLGIAHVAGTQVDAGWGAFAGHVAFFGFLYLQNGDLKRAEEYFAKASKLDPGDPRKRTSMALAHMAQGETGTALSELEEISAGDKGTTADMAMIATYLRRNEADKALKAIEVLEKKDPNNPATYNLRAGAQLGKKDVAGARKSFEKALSINPAYFPAAMALARMDVAEKKPDEARKRFEGVLAADPKNISAMLALADLRVASGGTASEVTKLLNRAIRCPAGCTPHHL